MDDLDRLYIELVGALRRRGPAALDEPQTIAELREEVIPYRKVRNPVGFRSHDEYETAFSRLVAGERSYLLGDPVVQDELRQALTDVLPDIRRHRKHEKARVSLNPATIPPPGDIRYAPPELRDSVDWTRAPDEPDAEEAGAEGDAEAYAADLEIAESAVDPDQPAVAEAADMEAADDGAAGEEPDAGVPSGDADLARCPACGRRPPEDAGFCPFCGRRLRSESCGECGTELQPEWRFCPECGTER